MTALMENAPGTFGMVEVRSTHDEPCLRPAIGITEGGGRVCEECAAAMVREGFRVDMDAAALPAFEPPPSCRSLAPGYDLAAVYVGVDLGAPELVKRRRAQARAARRARKLRRGWA